MNDYNINGYLYLESALIKNDYAHIKYKPEFLESLSNYLCQDLKKDWEKKSKSVILKCIIDITSIDMKDDYNNSMTPNEISVEIIKVSLESIINKLRYMFRGGCKTPIKYIFLKKDKMVLPENIIEY